MEIGHKRRQQVILPASPEEADPTPAGDVVVNGLVVAAPKRLCRTYELVQRPGRYQHGGIHPDSSIPGQQGNAQDIRKMSQVYESPALFFHDLGRESDILREVLCRNQSDRMGTSVSPYGTEASLGNVRHGLFTLPPADPYRGLCPDAATSLMVTVGILSNQFLGSGSVQKKPHDVSLLEVRKEFLHTLEEPFGL